MLRAFFDENNPVMRALAGAADLMVWNLLTLLCALPVVTAGAAYTALCDVCRRMVREEEPSVRDYFRALRANLRDGSLLGLGFLAAALVLYVDGQLAAAALPPLRVAVAAAGVVVLAVALYAFPLRARYDRSLWGTLKNAALLAAGFFPRTAAMTVLTIGFWLAVASFWRLLLPLVPLFGLSLPCYVCALLLDGVLDRLEGKA